MVWKGSGNIALSLCSQGVSKFEMIGRLLHNFVESRGVAVEAEASGILAYFQKSPISIASVSSITQGSFLD